MGTIKAGTREQLLAAKRPRELVHLPELGLSFWVQGLTAGERDAYEQSVMERKRDGRLVPNLKNARARLVALSLVDEDGTPLFRHDDDEMLVLGNIPARSMQKIWDKASELSGLSEEDVEALEGNSEAAPSGGSSSGSPSNSEVAPLRSSKTASPAAS